jgi:pyruvate-formate lyase-activating enzyme
MGYVLHSNGQSMNISYNANRILKEIFGDRFSRNSFTKETPCLLMIELIPKYIEAKGLEQFKDQELVYSYKEPTYQLKFLEELLTISKEAVRKDVSAVWTACCF